MDEYKEKCFEMELDFKRLKLQYDEMYSQLEELKAIEKKMWREGYKRKLPLESTKFEFRLIQISNEKMFK